MSTSLYKPVIQHPFRYTLAIDQNNSVGPPDAQFMMGGIGLAAIIDAMEQTTGRSLVWATVQFLAPARPSCCLDIDITESVKGRNIAQAFAKARVGETEILTAIASLGGKPALHPTQYATMPKVPDPQLCETLAKEYPELQDLQQRFERRYVPAADDQNSGVAGMWIRSLDKLPMSPGLLAIMADYLMGGLQVAMSSSSLDNTIRIHTLKASEWVFCDMRYHGIGSGVCHGDMNLFAQDGTLLASAGQSAILRHRNSSK